MVNAHVIEDGRVVNTIVVESLDFLPNLVDASLGGTIGDHWDGESFTKPSPLDGLTLDEIQAYFTAGMERHYDAVAAQRRYDDRKTCALRAGYPGPFQAEGIAFGTWMDTCNAYGYSVMDAVLGNQRAMPTLEGLLDELPVMVWPA